MGVFSRIIGWNTSRISFFSEIQILTVQIILSYFRQNSSVFEAFGLWWYHYVWLKWMKFWIIPTENVIDHSQILDQCENKKIVFELEKIEFTFFRKHHFGWFWINTIVKEVSFSLFIGRKTEDFYGKPRKFRILFVTLRWKILMKFITFTYEHFRIS